MSSDPATIPTVPTALRIGLSPLPLAPVTFAVDRLVRSLAGRHGAMFARLGEHAGKRFLIEPTDLPFVFVLEPRREGPAVTVARSRDGLACEARIAGPLAGLVGLVHGAYDGDALFFSRDLVIEGDVAAVLALRNAVDDAEIDLVAETAAAFGPLAGAAERIGALAAPALESLTGVPFTRRRSAIP